MRIRLLCLSLFAFFLLTAVAIGADAGTVDPTPPRVLWLPTDQLWTWIAAAVGFLPMYAINHYAPWVSETVKGFATTLFAAVAAGITQAVTAGGVGFNQTTLQFIITAVAAAFVAHKTIWQPTGLAATLKAGTNKQDVAAA